MVNYYHDLMPGAPTLNGVAGSLIAVLDACLVTGWGLQTATITVASGVATLTVPTAHPLELHQIARVEGATEPLLNADHRVLTRTSNTITFAAPGVADGAAAGSITFRVAPAGWTKPFTGTNKAVYRNDSVLGTGAYLRVDDTGTNTARVIAYEAMSDVDTGSGPFPTAPQISGGGWWTKSNSTSSAARAWTVVADERTAFIHMHSASISGESGTVRSFGDFASNKADDPYRSALVADIGSLASTSSSAIASVGFEYVVPNTSTSQIEVYLARSFTGLAGSVVGNQRPESFGASLPAASGAGYGHVNTYPNGPDNGLMLSRKLILESAAYRGNFRGGYLAPQNCHAAFARLAVIEGSGILAGRKLLAVRASSTNGSGGGAGVVFFDITGPW